MLRVTDTGTDNPLAAVAEDCFAASTAGESLLETVLISHGVPVRLSAHLERLSWSTEAVFGIELALDALRDAVRKHIRQLQTRSRMRLLVDSKGRWTIETAGVAAVPSDLSTLIPRFVPNGLGAHKWNPRPLAETALEMPLVCDADNEVLEASSANVFIREGGVIRTPPLDGRLLAGMTRMATIHAARRTGLIVSEEPLALADLERADDVFLSSAIRGVRSATLAGRRESGGDVVRLLAHAVELDGLMSLWDDC